MDAEWFVKLGLALIALILLPFALVLLAFFAILMFLSQLIQTLVDP